MHVMVQEGAQSGSDPWELLHIYQQRYGIPDVPEPALRLQRTLNRRKAKAHVLHRRVDDLECQLAETRKELKAVRNEIEGTRRAGELLVEEILDRVRREHGEGWSPTPVFGFRMWVVRDNSLYGAMTRWRTPQMTSTCLNLIPGEDVPHSIRRCGPPACGIYATKSLDVLRRELGAGDTDGYVVGVAALKGKVVEHDRGYRAAQAEASAVTACFEQRHLFTDDPTVIADLFENPLSAININGSVGKPRPGQSDRYLTQWKEKQDIWTWDTKFESSK